MSFFGSRSITTAPKSKKSVLAQASSRRRTNGNEFKSFSALTVALPKELKAKAAVLDGEIVSLDDQGRSQFNGKRKTKYTGVGLRKTVLARKNELRLGYCWSMVQRGREFR